MAPRGLIAIAPVTGADEHGFEAAATASPVTARAAPRRHEGIDIGSGAMASRAAA